MLPWKKHCTIILPARALALAVGWLGTSVGLAGYTKNIMITGYWPPTNEMIRRFSTNPEQNPQGWIGQNWRGLGYDVYAFFPEFPDGKIEKGVGDFEVDYQDTSYDWWRITEQIRPVALITFSRDNSSRNWKLEGGNRNYALNDWYPDYQEPTRPTPDLPIANEPVGNVRYSSLPKQEIIDAVKASGANVNPFVSTLDRSNFLSNFIGYHGNWYHDLHADPNDPYWNLAAGHIHVGRGTRMEDAILATEATLDALIRWVDANIPEPGTGLSLAVLAVCLSQRLRRGRAAR